MLVLADLARLRARNSEGSVLHQRATCAAGRHQEALGFAPEIELVPPAWDSLYDRVSPMPILPADAWPRLRAWRRANLNMHH